MFVCFLTDDLLKEKYDSYINNVRKILKLDGTGHELEINSNIPHIKIQEVQDQIQDAEFYNGECEIRYSMDDLYEIHSYATIYDVLSPMNYELFNYPSVLSKTDLFALRNLASDIVKRYTLYNFTTVLKNMYSELEPSNEFAEFIKNNENLNVLEYVRHTDRRIEFVKNHVSKVPLINELITVYKEMETYPLLSKIQSTTEYDDYAIDGGMFFDFLNFGGKSSAYIVNEYINCSYELNEDMMSTYMNNEISYNLKEYIETDLKIDDFSFGQEWFYDICKLYIKFANYWNLVSGYVINNYQLKLDL
jgi:hypothetical protein